MIRSFGVEGLNGHKEPLSLDLNGDVNLFTGKNGSGKTTLLKLMWFMISGNIERIAPEIAFRTATIRTDEFTLRLEANPPGESVPRRAATPDTISAIRWTFTPTGGEPIAKTAQIFRGPQQIEEANRHVLQHSRSSLFFPTFRRIEGGFSMGAEERTRRAPDGSVFFFTSSGIQSALVSLSQELSTKSHQFVASISTHDIVAMLTAHYANVSEQLNADHRQLSQGITELIGHHERSSRQQDALLSETQRTLEAIQAQVLDHSKRQEELLLPFTALSDLIGRIFRHKGIEVTARITLGDATVAIASDKLSAGEKQMLSFLVYNAFTTGGVIFIDEPEISLHVDWQRQLLPLLLAQGTKNQFVVATHSPFIYTRYSDKELILDNDRGDRGDTPEFPAA